MQNLTTRPAFVEANPHLRAAHLNAQRALFGAARAAHLQTTDLFKDAMIDGVNEALGLRGSRRLISRRQMTVAEMQAVTVAIEAGLFSEDWVWGHEFTISLTTRTMQVEVAEVHFTPRATSAEARSFRRLLNS